MTIRRPSTPPWQRVGLLVPSSNTVMEVDLVSRLARNVTLHTGRMYMEETTVEGENRMLDEFTIPAAEALGTVRPHVVVFGCTSAGALRGSDFDDALVARISEVASAKGVSVIRSVREAIAARDAHRIGVITPYVEDLNTRIRASLVDDGFDVVDIHGLGIDENFQIAEVGVDEIVDFAIRSFGDASIDLLFASCTNFRAFDAVDAIEERLGVPVVTSNQATLEAIEHALPNVAEAD